MKNVPILINSYFQEFTTGSCSDKDLIPVQEVHLNSVVISMSYLLVAVAVPTRTILNHIGNVSYQTPSCQRLLPTASRSALIYPDMFVIWSQAIYMKLGFSSYLPLICLIRGK